VSLDNIKLLTADEAKDATNNCDPGDISDAPGSVDAGFN
jgi:hypothetical protein